MTPPRVGPEHTEMRPGTYGRRVVIIQPTGDSSTALGHRSSPEKGEQALHRPHATEFKVKRSPSNEKLLEIVVIVAQPVSIINATESYN